jgi:hypothetical protein
MKEGPSRPAVRCRSQATVSCCRQERWWCCVKKVQERHAVREMKEDPACFTLTSASEKALIYTDEDLHHRMLVLYEADAIAKAGHGAYLLRTLLSEGEIRHETVEKAGKGFATKKITKSGPTGLIVTTTATGLDPVTGDFTNTPTNFPQCALYDFDRPPRSRNIEPGRSQGILNRGCPIIWWLRKGAAMATW